MYGKIIRAYQKQNLNGIDELTLILLCLERMKILCLEANVSLKENKLEVFQQAIDKTLGLIDALKLASEKGNKSGNPFFAVLYAYMVRMRLVVVREAVQKKEDAFARISQSFNHIHQALGEKSKEEAAVLAQKPQGYEAKKEPISVSVSA